MNEIENSGPLNNALRCMTCGPRSMEFESHMITIVDEYQRPIHQRPSKQMLCGICKKPAILVKKDLFQAEEEGEHFNEEDKRRGIKVRNEIYIEEPSDKRGEKPTIKRFF